MAKLTSVAPSHGSRRRFAPPHHEVPTEGRPQSMGHHAEAAARKLKKNTMQRTLSRQSPSYRAGGHTVLIRLEKTVMQRTLSPQSPSSRAGGHTVLIRLEKTILTGTGGHRLPPAREPSICRRASRGLVLAAAAAPFV